MVIQSYLSLVNGVRRWNTTKVGGITQAKENARLDEGLPYNCIVVENSHAERLNSLQPPSAEQSEFVALIAAFRDVQVERDVHFQVAVLTNENRGERYHWTAYDVLMTPAGQVHIFIFDAAEDQAAINQAHYIMRVLRPERCELFLYINRAHGENWILQASERGCSRFVIEHISRLSQCNIFTETLFPKRDKKELSTYGKMNGPENIFFGEEIPEDMSDHFYTVSLPTIVDSHPDLFRAAQSWGCFNRYPSRALKTVVSSSGRTLEQYARSNSEKVLYKHDETKWMNMTMFHKETSQERKVNGDVVLRWQSALEHFHHLIIESANPQAQFGNRNHGNVIRHLLLQRKENLSQTITFFIQQLLIIKLEKAQRNHSFKKPLFYWKLHFLHNINREKSDFIAREYHRVVNEKFEYSMDELRTEKESMKEKLMTVRERLENVNNFLRDLPQADDQVLAFYQQNKGRLDPETVGEIAPLFVNLPPVPAVYNLMRQS